MKAPEEQPTHAVKEEVKEPEPQKIVQENVAPVKVARPEPVPVAKPAPVVEAPKPQPVN